MSNEIDGLLIKLSDLHKYKLNMESQIERSIGEIRRTNNEIEKIGLKFFEKKMSTPNLAVLYYCIKNYGKKNILENVNRVNSFLMYLTNNSDQPILYEDRFTGLEAVIGKVNAGTPFNIDHSKLKLNLRNSRVFRSKFKKKKMDKYNKKL